MSQKRMDYYGSEALYRLVSKQVCVPIVSPCPSFKTKKDKIVWKALVKRNGEEFLETGSFKRDKWQAKRKELIGDYVDYHPTGFY